jgi:hypothetical protein
MTIQLTTEQWADIQSATEGPVVVSDPSQSTRFVLMPAEVYERLRPLFEVDPVADKERMFHLQEFGRRAGWDDPAMDVYDDLDPRGKR